MLSSVLIKPAGPDCNMRCTYCFYLHKSSLYPDSKLHRMSEHVLRELTAQYMSLDCDIASFCWQGGEPTLMGLDFFERAIKLQRNYMRKGKTVSNTIQTNGLLVDADWARFWHKNNFLVGISLDGPSELHDAYRVDKANRGTFERVMRSVELLREHQVDFNILCVLNDITVRYPETLVSFFLSHDLRFIQFIPCVEWDDSEGKIASFSVTPEAYGEFLCVAFDIWYNDGRPQFYERFFNDVLAVYAGYEMPTCIMKRYCGDYVVIEHNGDVYACDFFVEPNWKLGNILEKPLSELLKSDLLNRFRKRKRELSSECLSCRWLNICNGGCPKYRLICGDARSKNYFCEAYKRFFAHSHRRYLRLAERFRTFGELHLHNIKRYFVG
ncbi:MAG: hypothetical protein RUDDFDWM_001613 [Candidatus Fervidibacterota bacterium]